MAELIGAYHGASGAVWWASLLCGMRLRVSDVLDLLANGLSPEEILEEMPDLGLEDIRASRRLNHPVVAV